ncbi:helix-turn-helix domain-containing protein [Paenibacillus sp. DYY-L-2]|uniref:helix-turn-helix domain-containing protein n=1 Tax=Paenibacillus sp. DYY-L-2 TaxID=3447013 RepID=UPI003F5099A4
MASVATLFRKLLGVKHTVVEGHDMRRDGDGVMRLRIRVRPDAWHRDDCPHCGMRCPGYDTPSGRPRVWRGLDWGGVLVEVESTTHRVRCPEHGVVTAAVPWAYPGSGFTRQFDLTAAWLAERLPRSAVAAYMRIDWQTVGSCVSRALRDVVFCMLRLSN